jgi:hypothetical protein
MSLTQQDSDNRNLGTVTASEVLFRLGGGENSHHDDHDQDDNRKTEEKEHAEKLSQENSNNNNKNQNDDVDAGAAVGVAGLSAPPPRTPINKPDPNFHFYEVETWENWRWYPIFGWSWKLLPSDRYQYSSEDGKTELTKESFDNEKKKMVVFSNKEDGNDDKILVPAYDWVGDWEVVVEKDRSDGEGWRYARDFPCEYFPENFFGACVKRRLWIRRFKVPKNQ